MELKVQLPSYLVCALLFTASLSSANFEVSSSPAVTGIVGQDVVLPCQISTRMQPDNMEVQWKKIIQAQIENVHDYRAKTSQDVSGQEYQGRTVLLKDGFSSGNVSLKLKNVQPADEGTYSCIVKSNEWSADASTELKIAAVAPVSIDVLGPQDQGIKLACRSAGWFPSPELLWVTKKGLNLQPVTKMEQDRQRLFNVLSHVTVLGEDTGEITCKIQNSLLKMEQKSAILLSAKQKKSKNKSSEEDTLFIRETERKNLEADCKDLRERLDRATTELDFRRARSYMVPITLDPSYKHPELTVSADGRTVQHNPPSPELAASSGALIAVGKEGFPGVRDHNGKAGVDRWYWEVDLGDSQTWELGVLSDTVRSEVGQNRLERTHEGGFWALGRSEGQYHPKEADDMIQKWTVKPTVIGVCLDLEWGHLSFYSVNGMGPIIEIPVQCSESLFPFLSPGFAVGREKGKPLSICPYSDWDFHQKLMGGQGNPTASAQSSSPNTGEGAEYNTESSATGTTGSVPAQHPAPATHGVKANSSGSSRLKIFRNPFQKGRKGDTTKQ